MTPEEVNKYIKSGKEVYCIFQNSLVKSKLIYLDTPNYSRERFAQTENFKIDIKEVFESEEFCRIYLISKINLKIDNLTRNIVKFNKQISDTLKQIDELNLCLSRIYAKN
jgi:hypothetical protein